MDERNISIQTCSFGYTGTDCSITYSAFHPSQYQLAQAIYCVLGMTTAAFSAYKFGMAVHTGTSALQLRVFFVVFLCSITFLVRGIDPGSYGGYIPRIVTAFLVNSCTAAIYTLLVQSATFWFTIIQGLTLAQRPRYIVIFEVAIAVCIWSFYIGFDLLRLNSKGFGGRPFWIRDIAAAAILFTITATLVFYGWQICGRLRDIDNMARQHTAISATLTMEQVGQDMEAQKCKVMPRIEQNRAQRMQRLLLLISSISLAAILLQLYAAHTAPIDGINAELQCSNGKLSVCQTLTATVTPLQYMQYVALCSILWGYRTIRKAE